MGRASLGKGDDNICMIVCVCVCMRSEIGNFQYEFECLHYAHTCDNVNICTEEKRTDRR